MTKAKRIDVVQDDGANYTFIIGTDDAVEAEAALRAQEDVWYGPVESRDPENAIERPLDFAAFYPGTFYVRGDFLHWDREALPKGRGRVAEKPGFMAPIE